MCSLDSELERKLREYKRVKKLDEFIEANKNLPKDLRWFLVQASTIRKLLRPFDESEKKEQRAAPNNWGMSSDRRRADRRTYTVPYETGSPLQDRRQKERRG